MKVKSKHFFFILLFILVTQYVVGQKLYKRDLAAMYSEYYFTTFEASVYHFSEDSSTVHLNISLHHLNYLDAGNGKQQASFVIKYDLYPSYNSKVSSESRSIVFEEQDHSGEVMDMAIQFNIGARFPGNYILRVELVDLNAMENSVFKFIHINKLNKSSGQNFFMTDTDNYPLFGGFVLQDSYFKLSYNNPAVDELIIRYYNQRFPIAKPPFSSEKNTTYTFEPDSFFTVQLVDGVSSLLELPYHGIYYIQTKLDDVAGLTLYRYDDGFPDVNQPAQAIAPLRYLTNEKEYDKMLSYSDYKIAIDSFWLERASYEPERAKKMIRKFYQRVVDVNHLFTSFQEGWKTDRGLTYIIYGPPSEVYRKDGEEEWIYGERGNPMSIRFYFLKTENPFTENDFTMQRSPVYKTSWYIAVENWRR